MRSRSDQLTSNRSNLPVPLLTFPCHTPVPTLRIIIALIVCTGLHEFDRTLSQELLKALKCDLVGFYLYSETAKAFSPVSDLLTSLSARKEQLARQHEQLSAAQMTVRSAEVQYRKGPVNYLDVLETQRTTLGAETNWFLPRGPA